MLSEEVERELGLEYSALEGGLSSSDVLSLNVPLTDETRGMIGAEEIAMMKAGVVLINMARGEVVEYQALAEALKSGHLRGAAVDVSRTSRILGFSPAGSRERDPDSS